MAEGLEAFFTLLFTNKVSSQASRILMHSGRDWSTSEEKGKKHICILETSKSVGQDGVHLRVLRELVNAFPKSPSTGQGSWWLKDKRHTFSEKTKSRIWTLGPWKPCPSNLKDKKDTGNSQHRLLNSKICSSTWLIPVTAEEWIPITLTLT